MLLIVLVAGFFLFGSAITYVIQQEKIASKNNLDLEFAGKVTYIYYDVKQFPTITIDSNDYYIGAGYHTDHQIEVGDSVIKRRSSGIYKLIKRKSGRIVEFMR